MNDLRALLAPIRARHEADAPLCKDTCPSEECQAMQDRARLLAAIEAVAGLADEWDAIAKGTTQFDSALRVCAHKTRTALAAALGSDTTNQEGTQ